MYVTVPQPTSGFLPELTAKERFFVGIGLLGIAGWGLFGDRIKGALKRR